MSDVKNAMRFERERRHRCERADEADVYQRAHFRRDVFTVNYAVTDEAEQKTSEHVHGQCAVGKMGEEPADKP